MANVINATSTGNGGLVSTGDDSGILNIQTNETTAITVDASQNVGIGLTSPTSKLDITGAISLNNVAIPSAGTARIYSRNTDSNLYIQTGSGNTAYLLDGSQNTMYAASPTLQSWQISNSEKMRLDSSGNLLINSTSTLNAVLNVTGKSGISPCSLRVNTDGDYGYTFKNASNTLVGAIAVNASTTSYNTSSDYRLKENIAPMTGALAKVAQLKPVTYDWKSGGSSQGFIAHELQAVVSDCVTGEKDAVDADGNPKYQGIDTSFLVATLTAAIQELKAINDTQAETINALTARIVALEQA